MRETGTERRQADDQDPRGATQITTPNALKATRSMHLHVECRSLTWEQHSTHATRHAREYRGDAVCAVPNLRAPELHMPAPFCKRKMAGAKHVEGSEAGLIRDAPAR